jgi:hypothetical protein
VSELNDRAHQFRLIEKRLLVRFKDRNPAPLNNLDVLLNSTHEQLITLGTRVRPCVCCTRRSEHACVTPVPCWL